MFFDSTIYRRVSVRELAIPKIVCALRVNVEPYKGVVTLKFTFPLALELVVPIFTPFTYK